MNMRTVLAICVSAYVVGLVLFGRGNEASAAYRRVHASQCHAYYDDAGSDLFNGAFLANGTTGRGIVCPAPSDSTLPHATTVTLNVHGYNGSSGSPYSEGCALAYTGSSITCGTYKYWGAGAAGVYGLGMEAWNADASAFPYVFSYLPPGAELFGFYMAN